MGSLIELSFLQDDNAKAIAIAMIRINGLIDLFMLLGFDVIAILHIFNNANIMQLYIYAKYLLP